MKDIITNKNVIAYIDNFKVLDTKLTGAGTIYSVVQLTAYRLLEDGILKVNKGKNDIFVGDTFEVSNEEKDKLEELRKKIAIKENPKK